MAERSVDAGFDELLYRQGLRQLLHPHDDEQVGAEAAFFEVIIAGKTVQALFGGLIEFQFALYEAAPLGIDGRFIAPAHDIAGIMNPVQIGSMEAYKRTVSDSLGGRSRNRAIANSW